MRPVAVVGIGKTRFGAFPDRDLLSLAVEAGQKCLENGHVSPSQVEAFFLGNFAGPSFTGQNHLALIKSACIPREIRQNITGPNFRTVAFQAKISRYDSQSEWPVE
jgi:acetyl-CoA acetyltransferase